MFEEITRYDFMSLLLLFSGIVSFIRLRSQKAPYGRYYTEPKSVFKNGIFGVEYINSKLAWIFAEVPGVFIGVYFIHCGLHQSSAVNILCCGMYVLHYFHRLVSKV